MRTTTEAAARSTRTQSGVPILARSLFKQMRDQGYSTEQIIGFSTELIDLVRTDMRTDWEPAE